jgi:ABC-2 type transport system permease protein
MLLPPLIIALLIVGTAISVAFFTTMKLFDVSYTQEVMWNVVAIIFLFVFSMESISYFLALNIRNGAVLAGIITLIVIPAFMYSGYLIPLEQMADVPQMIGNWFPLSHYLRALYPVFNHKQELSVAYPEMNILWKFVGLFLVLSLFSIIIGQIERKRILKKIKES